MNMTTTLRMRCPCGRNLADVTYNEHNPTWTHDKLVVRARPNVRMRDFRPWSEAMKTASDPLPKVDGMSILDILRAQVARKRALARGDANPPPAPPPLPPRGPRRPARPDLAGVEHDWMDHTYTWWCRCGQELTRRHERISAAWEAHGWTEATLVRLTLTVDL